MCLAWFASFVTLKLAGRMHTADRRLRWYWCVGGSLVMGTGIWSMHFVGMMGFELDVLLGYRADLTALSWLAALVASGIALAIAGQERLTALTLAAGSLSMAAAICGMRYTGMAAAQFPFGAICLSADQLGGQGLGMLVTGAAMLMLTGALLTAVLDARMQARETLLSGSLRSANEQLRSANDELQRLAFQDALTELPNRMLFEDRLQHAAARIERGRPAGAARAHERPGERLAVLFLDPDGFKPVNDTYGHALGDVVLREVARRLRFIARDADTLARIGGDEFVLLMEGVGSAGDAVAMAERLTQALLRPFDCEGREVSLSCSVGLALYPEHGPADKLVASADPAMYTAKRNGGAGYAVYDEAMAGDGGEQVALQHALRHAIERQE